MKPAHTAAVLLALVSFAALAQESPNPVATHPPGGHPTIPKPADDWPKADAADVGSMDAIMAAFYEATSGEPGQPRQWERYRSLFLPGSRLVAARAAGDGTSGAFFLSPDEFVEANRKYFEKGGFFDKEVARRVESFGYIAHVWSTYESRRTRNDASPYVRGINSMQLLKDGDRWWIVNVFWDYERPGAAIPDKYLQTPAP